MATDEPRKPFRTMEDAEEFYSEIGKMTERPPGPICGVVFHDEADGGEVMPQICWKAPHSATEHHEGRSATPKAIVEAADLNRQNTH